MAPNDPKQGGGFFSSIASSLTNFGSAMTRSVNGYWDPSDSIFFFFILSWFDLISSF